MPINQRNIVYTHIYQEKAQLMILTWQMKGIRIFEFCINFVLKVQLDIDTNNAETGTEL